jgi:hypothetical protein
VVAWSTTDKSANVTLSGGNLTATWTSNTQGGVRCDTSFAGGLRYFELYAAVAPLGNLSVGWANATQSLAGNVGSSLNSVGVVPGNNAVSINNATIGGFEHSTQQNAIPYTIRVAVNFTTGLWWAMPVTAGGNLQFWNGSTTADPVAGTGGLSLSTLAAGPYFPMVDNINGSTTASVTARFGAADMWYPTPSGFSTLDTNVQAFEAVPKFSGEAILIPPQAAANAYKFSGEALLMPPQAAASVYKMSGYAILRPKNDNVPSKSRLYAYLRM